MNYDAKLAERVREYLGRYPGLKVEEKSMFGGLAFMVKGKMCVNVSGINLMCRFDHELQKEVEARPGFQPMIMKGKKFNGYCYVSPEGYKSTKDFEYWLNLCLDFNERAKASKKK